MSKEIILAIGKVIFLLVVFFTPLFLYFFKEVSESVFWIWFFLFAADDFFD